MHLLQPAQQRPRCKADALPAPHPCSPVVSRRLLRSFGLPPPQPDKAQERVPATQGGIWHYSNTTRSAIRPSHNWHGWHCCTIPQNCRETCTFSVGQRTPPFWYRPPANGMLCAFTAKIITSAPTFLPNYTRWMLCSATRAL